MPQPIPAPAPSRGGEALVPKKKPKPRGYLTAPSAAALAKDRSSINANTGKIAGVNKGLLKGLPPGKSPGQQQGGRQLYPTNGPVTAAPPEDPIMSMFRRTLEQIKAATSPVDEATIREPYDTGATVAGQVGQGAALADQGIAQRASDTYNAAAKDATAHAASFGIATGAGPGGLMPNDNANQMLALQNQAEQNAHIGAATAWQQLLNRTATSAVNTARQKRQEGIDSASQSLAASLPTMYQNKDTLDFQKKSQQDTNDYLWGTLTEKQRAALAQAQLDRDKLNSSNATDAARTGILQQNANTAGRNATTNEGKLTEQIAHDKATVKGANYRARLAAKKGVLGTQEVMGLLNKVTSKSQNIIGYKVTYPVDPNGIFLGGKPLTMTVPNVNSPAPSGYLDAANNYGVPVYGPSTAKGGGVTLAIWNQGVGVLQLRNNWTKAQAVKAMQKITPRPKG